MIKVFMGIPSQGERSDHQTYMLREIEKRYKDKIELVYPEVMVTRKFHDFARNGVVEEFLESDCDLLWFLDSDVVPPPHVLDLITEHGDEWKVAGAVYPVFMGGAVVIPVYTRDEDDNFVLSMAPPEGQDMVSGLATGCMFIHREVLEKMEKPYFSFRYNPENMCLEEGEDVRFCKAANELGYKFFTDFGMICRHFKQVDLLDVNNYAMEFANAKVQAYDSYIRPKVEEMARRLSGKISPKPQKKSNLILPNHID